MREGECFPTSGCGCVCHNPLRGMAVSHFAACCASSGQPIPPPQPPTQPPPAPSNPPTETFEHCVCGERFDGDNFCMVSACQWEGIEVPC